MESYPRNAWSVAARGSGRIAGQADVDKRARTDDGLVGRTGHVESRGASALISA